MGWMLVMSMPTIAPAVIDAMAITNVGTRSLVMCFMVMVEAGIRMLQVRA